MRSTHGTASRAAAGIALLLMLTASVPVLAAGRLSVLPSARAHLVKKATGAAAVDCPACDPMATLNVDLFPHPRHINNEFYPLEPGTQLTYEGRISRDGTPLPHQVIFTVTDLVKTIAGVPCVVVWDQDFNEDQLTESELAFFAQDVDQNVWVVGEYPEEYDGGVLIGAENTWIHGIENADAGVLVPGHPTVGTPGFRQAIAPENDFWDCGMVYAKSKKEKFCVPFGCYKDVLTIREWAPLDGCDAIQLKYYQKHFGVFQVGALGDPESEILVLTDARRLDSEAREAANQSALALDRRGPEVNEHYALTEPAQLIRHGKAKHDAGDDGDADQPTVQFGQVADSAPRTFMAVTRNPVTTGTSIEYGIAQAGPVEIAVFDIAGRRIRSLVNQTMAAGSYQVDWNATNEAGQSVSNGVYFASLRTASQVVRKTLVIMR